MCRKSDEDIKNAPPFDGRGEQRDRWGLDVFFGCCARGRVGFPDAVAVVQEESELFPEERRNFVGDDVGFGPELHQLVGHEGIVGVVVQDQGAVFAEAVADRVDVNQLVLNGGTRILNAAFGDIDFAGHAQSGIDGVSNIFAGVMMRNSMTNNVDIVRRKRAVARKVAFKESSGNFGAILGVVFVAANEAAATEHASNICQGNLVLGCIDVGGEIGGDIGHIKPVADAKISAELGIVVGSIGVYHFSPGAPLCVFINLPMDTINIFHRNPSISWSIYLSLKVRMEIIPQKVI